MNKLLFKVVTAALLIVVGSYAFAAPTDEQLQELKGMADTIKAQGQSLGKTLAPFYQNLQTCTPYQDELTHIYGKVNNQCHFVMGGYDCNTPLMVSTQYGKIGAELMVAMEKWDTMTLDRMSQSKSYYQNFEANTVKYYCKMK